MPDNDLARIEYEIRREEARFRGESPPVPDEEERNAEAQEGVSLGELLLGGALVGMILLVIAATLALVAAVVRKALKPARRNG